MSSRIPAATLDAYRQTDYRVEAPAPFTLRIDRPSTALFELHSQHGVCSSAFLTAYNSHSRLLSQNENEERQWRLAQTLIRDDWHYLPGNGKHISGPWPAEASFLVLGIGREAAGKIARDFEQNAYVYCGADCIPQLVLLR